MTVSASVHNLWSYAHGVRLYVKTSTRICDAERWQWIFIKCVSLSCHNFNAFHRGALWKALKLSLVMFTLTDFSNQICRQWVNDNALWSNRIWIELEVTFVSSTWTEVNFVNTLVMILQKCYASLLEQHLSAVSGHSPLRSRSVPPLHAPLISGTTAHRSAPLK